MSVVRWPVACRDVREKEGRHVHVLSVYVEPIAVIDVARLPVLALLIVRSVDFSSVPCDTDGSQGVVEGIEGLQVLEVALGTDLHV